MLVSLSLPSFNALAQRAEVIAVHIREGQALAPGAKLMDLQVDLSAAADHDCPPVSSYRLLLREQLFVRRVLVRAGDEAQTGALLALLSKEPDGPIDGTPERSVRVSVAGLLSEPDWWETQEP